MKQEQFIYSKGPLSGLEPEAGVNREDKDNKALSITDSVSQLDDQGKSQMNTTNPNMIKGGAIGMIVSALISWNAGKYNRVGRFLRRWRFVRNFVISNPKPEMPHVFTNYYIPPLNTVVKNFMCYSGEAGIGKSTHFMHLAYTQSGVRPALYISFKASGKDATFEEDIAQQIGYGSESPGIFSQIITAIKKIDEINKHPHKFWLKIFLTHLVFAGGAYSVAISSLEATYGMLIFSFMGGSYLYYLNFIYPLLIQSFRRTAPLIIFDDLNKIEHLNNLPEIVRYLQLQQNNMANIILVSPDEDTWSKLRREPGVKDRLRVRQVYYNHAFTADALVNFIKTQQNFRFYMKYVHGSGLYTRKIVISLIKELIGKRQVTLRRFSSILVLNDEEECEKLTQVLIEGAEGKIQAGEAVQRFTDILYDSQSRTMVANLKSIKRQVQISDQQFFDSLKLLLKKKKLSSDNQIATHLKAYNIVRDMQSEYVFNGKFMFTVFNMAIQEYEKDLKKFKKAENKNATVLEAPIMAPVNNMSEINTQQISSETRPPSEEPLKNWNKTNVLDLNTNIVHDQKKETKQDLKQNVTFEGKDPIRLTEKQAARTQDNKK